MRLAALLRQSLLYIYIYKGIQPVKFSFAQSFYLFIQMPLHLVTLQRPDFITDTISQLYSPTNGGYCCTSTSAKMFFLLRTVFTSELAESRVSPEQQRPIFFRTSGCSLLRRNICSVWAPMCEIQFLS